MRSPKRSAVSVRIVARLALMPGLLVLVAPPTLTARSIAERCLQAPRERDERAIGPGAADQLDPDREPVGAAPGGHRDRRRAEQRPGPAEQRVAGGVQAHRGLASHG